ncbi:MAG: Omp28-related outer membrane protein [Bacteroidaceae bacterium]|nr:Omp28-related outer membrane protein [Bacteroidaceae bacterium]
MKHLYQLILMVCLTTIPAGLNAQNTSGRAFVGYANFDDQIWEYDGLSLDHTARVGCAVLLTREMLEPYIGGTIVSLRAGWDTSTQTGKYDGFVRSTFNGEDLSTGSGTVSYSYSSTYPGWNNITMTDYQIPEDVEQLVVGFTTTLKKDVCAIPMLYPKGVENSCYLWVEGDNDEQGAPVWRDMHNVADQYGTGHGILPIILGIKDTQGTFNYIPTVTMLTHNGVMATEEAGDCLVRLKNNGSQSITSLAVTWRQGEQEWTSSNVPVSLLIGRTSKSFLLPAWCFHSGDVEMSITRVNGNPVPHPEVYRLNVIGVPREVDETYMRRPLVEYYESENNYMSARYYDDYVVPCLRGYTEDITLVCQHLDDQFMTGDDDATTLALRLCDNDSSQVSIPAMSIDRAMGTENYLIQQNATKNPMFPVYTTDGLSLFREAMTGAMNRPTFLELEVKGTETWNADEASSSLEVEVTGEMAEGVMPEGERPRLTVYLMERNVHTDSQIFWTEKEKEEYQGEYVHANVIREVLSAPEGDELIAEGKYFRSGVYKTELDPEWKKGDLYLVAFVHRDGSQGGRAMHVFNTAEGKIDFDADGIEEVKNEEIRMKNEVHDLAGRRVSDGVKANANGLKKGLYIMNGKKIVIRNS